MIDLQECRNEIDKIDSDIIRLFEQRMKVCEDVAEYKIRTCLLYTSPSPRDTR